MTQRANLGRLYKPFTKPKKNVWPKKKLLAPCTPQLQTASQNQDWVEVLTLGTQILTLSSTYLDVPSKVRQAKEALNQAKQPVTEAKPDLPPNHKAS